MFPIPVSYEAEAAWEYQTHGSPFYFPLLRFVMKSIWHSPTMSYWNDCPLIPLYPVLNTYRDASRRLEVGTTEDTALIHYYLYKFQFSGDNFSLQFQNSASELTVCIWRFILISLFSFARSENDLEPVSYVLKRDHHRNNTTSQLWIKKGRGEEQSLLLTPLHFKTNLCFQPAEVFHFEK